ncbi:MAG: glutamine synthetase beta-grasp domain-containing protein, partial [Chloroflexota bacterium]
MTLKEATKPAEAASRASQAKLTTPKEVIEFARKNGLKIVDFKFVDLPGTWQHFSATIGELNEEVFADGIGFDGSSIRGFQAIHESDMLLMPDPTTAVVDPVCTVPTLSLACNVLDPLTREPYSRDPRHIAQKAEAYLKKTGIADTSYWGPEAEFFIFDNVRFEQT